MKLMSSDGKALMIKEVTKVPRAGKEDLHFINFVDTNTFDQTGSLLFFPADGNTNRSKGELVIPILSPSQYNGKTSFSVTGLESVK